MLYKIQPIRTQDRGAIRKLVTERWGGEKIILQGEVFQTADLPGLQAIENGEMIGFLHYQIRDDACEIITLASLQQRKGIGSVLVEAIESISKRSGCKTLKVTTTNDNLGALGFYQSCGFLIAGQGLGLVDEARRLKPEIPAIGNNNIPIHDEIYLEKHLGKPW